MRVLKSMPRLASACLGLLLSKRDLADALPPGSWTPAIVAAAVIVILFGIIDIVSLAPR